MTWAALADVVDLTVAQAFGATVTLVPTTGAAPLQVTATFDREYFEVSVEADVAVSSARPSLWLRLGSTPRPEKGGAWTVAGTSYQITDVRPDGPGAVRCFGVEA